MAMVFKDRVLETSTTTGTGTYTLAGAVTGYRTFAAIGNANTCRYYAEEVDANGIPSGAWEVGIGTYTSSGTTLARTAILDSSTGSAISWGAGTKRLGVTPGAKWYQVPAVRAVRTSVQSITAGQTTEIVLNAADDFDTDSMHDPAGANPSRVVFNTAGLYCVIGMFHLSLNASTSVIATFRVNGTTLYYGLNIPGNTVIINLMQVMRLLQVAAGDYVELQATHNAGGNEDVEYAALEAWLVSPTI